MDDNILQPQSPNVLSLTETQNHIEESLYEVCDSMSEAENVTAEHASLYLKNESVSS